MIRRPSFDCAGTEKRIEILKTLEEREFSVGELKEVTKQNRSSLLYSLRCLEKNGLVGRKDTTAKPRWYKSLKKTKNIQHWFITAEGICCLDYFLLRRLK